MRGFGDCMRNANWKVQVAGDAADHLSPHEKSSTYPEPLVELCGELRGVRQRHAIHGSDRNCTAEAAGPEGAARLEKILDRAAPDRYRRPLIIKQVHYLTPRYSGQYLLIERRRAPEPMLILYEDVSSTRLTDVMWPDARSEERQIRPGRSLGLFERRALDPLVPPSAVGSRLIAQLRAGWPRAEWPSLESQI